MITPEDVTKLFDFLKSVDTCLLHTFHGDMDVILKDTIFPHKHQDKGYVWYFESADFATIEYAVCGKILLDRNNIVSITWNHDQQSITIKSVRNDTMSDNRNREFHIVIWNFKKSVPVLFN